MTDPLIAAVRRGDADAVRDLLETGADPDPDPLDGPHSPRGPHCPDAPHGLTPLCLAVAAYDEPVAEALLEGGADPLRRLPDGTTALLRAVDSGSNRMTELLVRHRPPLPAADREELLNHARHRVQADPEAELRRSTGVDGPVTRVRVVDDEIDWWSEELTLGGLAVRDEHLAILTSLETRYRQRHRKATEGA